MISAKDGFMNSGRPFGAQRRFSDFRAYPEISGDPVRDTRLVGRSVWNTQWILMIPGSTLNADPVGWYALATYPIEEHGGIEADKPRPGLRLIAAAQSLHGHRGFNFDPMAGIDPETPRDAKGWMKARMAGAAYGETTDQPAFSARMDLQAAYDGSRSFRKLCSEWDRQVETA